MTPQAVKSALEGLLATLFPNTPIAWPNTDFTTPSAEYLSLEGVSYLRPTFKPGQSFECEIGREGLSRRTGVFIVQVFVPRLQGSGFAMEASATIEESYRRQELSGVECDEPYTNDVGDTDCWYQVNVIVPWWAWIGE